MNSHAHRLVFSRSRGFCVAVAETATAAGKSVSGERRSRVVGACAFAALALASLVSPAQGLPAGVAPPAGLKAGVAAPAGVAPAPAVRQGAGASVLPTGATVVKGSGSVSVNGADMTVNQSSQRLVTDWTSFSIGSGNSVRFIQPSSSSVALNRVTGDGASNIFGSLTANGHVYLQNANGVYFAPGAQVSVGSLVATSLNIDVDQFMLGRLRLSGGSEASGKVENAGAIVTAPGGHAVLAGPVVSNSGSIRTPGGTTALVAGNAVDIDPLGSGLLSVSVPVAAVNARLAQSGTITADGGAVQLAAAAADAAVRTVMQVGGVVRARSVEQRDGQIVLSGGSSGMVIVDGQLDASGGTGRHGGTIKVLGDRVGLTGGARLDATGGGGGTILVGGNWQGKGPETNATNTYVGSGVVLDASAAGKGDGGKVVVWADANTTYAGQANARGGASGGDGGRIEVSGKGSLAFYGGADLRAPHGTTGNLLLDPQNLTIGNVADVDGTPPTGDDLVGRTLAASAPGANSQITASNVATLLATGNVTLASQFNLTVAQPITVAAGGDPTAVLSLTSANVLINAPLTLNNASLVANTTPTFTTQSIVLNAAVQSNNSVSLTSPTITINAALTAPNVTLTSGGTIAQNATGTGTIVATNLTTLGAGSVDLSFSNNQVGNLVFNANDAKFRVANAVGVPLNVSGTITGVSGVLDLVGVNTDITQSPGPTGALALAGGQRHLNLTTVGTGNVALNNSGNQIHGVTFNVAGAASLVAQGDLGGGGGATGDVAIQASGVFTLNNNLSGRNIDITSVGFQANNTLLLTPPGGRFFLRSSDWTKDFFNSPLFGTAANDINYIVLGGFSGTDPSAGNGYYTNRTGTLAPPVIDNPPISKVYDGTPNFAFTQSGANAVATLQAPSVPIPFGVTGYNVVGTGAFTDKNAGANKGHTVAPSTDTSAVSPTEGNVVYYGLRFAGYTRAPGPHVAGTPGNAVSQITQRAISAVGIGGVNRVYNGSNVVGVNAGGASLAGTIAGDTVSLVAAGATGTTADKNVGVNKPVAVSGLGLAGTDAGNYSVSAAPGATSTITPLGIISFGFTGVNRTYDATTVVAVNGSGATLTGVLGGDTVGVAAGNTGTVANKNVGAAKPVTIGTVALNGADAANYTVTDTSAALVTITPLAITSTGVTGVDRTYDGTAVVGVNTGAATLNGTIAGDNVSLVTGAATGTMANKNAGNAKPVAVGGLTLGGTDAVNYSLVDASNATVNIAAAVLRASGITAVNKVVNGTTTVRLNTSNVSVLGVVPGDTVGVDASGATGSVATPDPGVAKPVTVIGIGLTGPDAINYSISPFPIGPSGGGLTVRFLTASQGRFDDIRFKEYLQAVSDAQEPFRRAMMEALLAGFGKENIRKQLQRGLVFETGLAPPAVDIIEPAAKPDSCTPPAGADLNCGR